MAAVSLDDLFTLGADVLGTSLTAQGTILCQTGDVVGSQVSGDNTEFWQHIGFASLPSLPEPGKVACQVLAINSGSNDIAFASRDIRTSSIYGNLQPGETTLYACGPQGTGQAKVLLKQDGAVTLYTTETNKSDGAGVYLRLAPDKLEFHAPWGRLVFDAAGLHIETQNGGYFDLSNTTYLGTMPGSMCTIAASTVTIDAPMVFLGPSDVATSGVPTGGGYAAATANALPPALLPGLPFTIPITGAPSGPTVVPNLFTSPSVFIGTGIPG